MEQKDPYDVFAIPYRMMSIRDRDIHVWTRKRLEAVYTESGSPWDVSFRETESKNVPSAIKSNVETMTASMKVYMHDNPELGSSLQFRSARDLILALRVFVETSRKRKSLIRGGGLDYKTVNEDAAFMYMCFTAASVKGTDRAF